jgi:hypothetical protein
VRFVSTRTGTRVQFLCPIFVGNCDGILEQLLRATGEPLGAVMRGSIGRRWRAQHAVHRFETRPRVRAICTCRGPPG